MNKMNMLRKDGTWSCTLGDIHFPLSPSLSNLLKGKDFQHTYRVAELAPPPWDWLEGHGLESKMKVKEIVEVVYLSIRHQQEATLANLSQRRNIPGGYWWFLALPAGRTESEPRSAGTAWLGCGCWHLPPPAPPSLLPSVGLIGLICHITHPRIKVTGQSSQLTRPR